MFRVVSHYETFFSVGFLIRTNGMKYHTLCHSIEINSNHMWILWCSIFIRNVRLVFVDCVV